MKSGTRKPAKILIIDDDPDFVEATKVVLESKPYAVVTALSGEEGLKKAREERPDAILLDIIMPLIDGFAVADRLKKDPQLARIPVLILTSFSQKRGETSISVSQGLSLQVEDYLDKPVKPKELLRRVANLLKKRGQA